MTTTIQPPTIYRHWTGAPRRLRAAADLERLWTHPTLDYDPATRRATIVIDDYQHGAWLHLGFAPRSRTRWQRLWRHWHHGRLMGYPRLSVAAFCLRGLFLDPPEPTR